MNDTRTGSSGSSLHERSTRRNVLRGLIGAAIVGVAGSGFRGPGSQAQESSGPIDLAAAPGGVPSIVDGNPVAADVDSSNRLGAAGVRRDQAVSFSVAVRIVLNPTAGVVGSTVSAFVYGFRPNEYVEISWRGNRGFDVIASGRVNRSGKATFTFQVPAAPAGRARVAVAGRSFDDVANFDVLRSLQLSPPSGPGGSPVQVTLQGFRANIPHRIVMYPFPFRAGLPVELGRIGTSGVGSGSTNVTIPAGSTPGGHWIEVLEPGGRAVAGAVYTVVAVATTTPNPTVTMQPSTPTPQATYTLVPSTSTPTPQATYTLEPSTSTPTPQATYTLQPSTSTPTPQATYTLVPSTSTPTPQATYTLVPSTSTPTPQATYTLQPSTSTSTPQATYTLQPSTSTPTPQPTYTPPPG